MGLSCPTFSQQTPNLHAAPHKHQPPPLLIMSEGMWFHLNPVMDLLGKIVLHTDDGATVGCGISSRDTRLIRPGSDD